MNRILIPFLLMVGLVECRAQQSAVDLYDLARQHITRNFNIEKAFKRPECQAAVGKRPIVRVYDSLVCIGLESTFADRLVRDFFYDASVSRHQQDSLGRFLVTRVSELWARDSLVPFPSPVMPLDEHYNGFIVLFSGIFERLIPGKKILLASLLPVTQGFLEPSARKVWWLRYGNCEYDFVFVFDEKNRLIKVYNGMGYNN